MSILRMGKILFKNMLHGSYTISYPLEKKTVYERTRGRIEIDIAQCVYCGSCQRNCPVGAIQVSRADGKWSIDRMKCIQCSYCSEVCPKKCLHMSPDYAEPSSEKIRTEYENARISDHSEDH